MGRPAATEIQKRAFAYALKHPYSILALDPRLGKSRVAIGIQKKLKNNCLVICPSYLVLNWKKEIDKWSPGSIVSVFEKGKDIYEICDADFAIISYSLAQKAENFFEWADMVVIDEGHNLKSMDAKRTQFIHRVIYENSIKRLHILTGTPLKNRVKEWYSLLALMYYDPKIGEVEEAEDFKSFLKKNITKAKGMRFLDRFPSEIDFADYFSWREQYTLEINGRFIPIIKWKGLKNKEELKMYLEGRYIRIRASEKDLPPVQYKSILVSSSNDKKLLEAFNTYFMNDESGSVAPDLKAEAALKKVPFTIEYVKNLLEQVESVVVFTDHRESANAIAEAFGTKALSGGMPAKIRSRNADAFQNGEGNCLVCTIGGMKEGKDLWRAKDVVFNDYPWVPGDLKQAINRIRSMGSMHPCTVHKIMGSPQDEYITEALEEKVRVIDAAT